MTATHTKQLRLLSLLLMLAMAVAALPSLGSPPVASAATPPDVLRWNHNDPVTSNFFVAGIDPKTPGVETDIPDFQFLIVEDNVGDTQQARSAGCDRSDPQYPANCNWPSIQTQSGYAPIVTQGSASDFDANGLFAGGIALEPGSYMISVTAAGHKIDGTWFTIPLAEGEQVKVRMNTYDLPTSTLRAIIFNDNAPTNGMPDVPAEPGLGGFRVTVNDMLGQVTADVYGNPICTIYERDGNRDVIFDADGPVSTGVQQLNGCLYTSDGTADDPVTGETMAEGFVAVPNLGPNRYTMLMAAPDGEQWIQTATLEGNHDWDVWVQEGSTGYDTEFAVAGEPFPWVPIGYVKPNTATVTPGATGGISGRVMGVTVHTPFTGGIPYSGSIWGGLSGAKIDKPIDNAWISLSDLTDGDQAVWTGQASPNGEFYIPNVHDGSYMITWWDFDQLYLLDWKQVDVKNGQITAMGDLHLTAWYSHLSGRVCTDTNYDGICQSAEPGIAGFPIAVKRRTNSIIDRGSMGAVTDTDGKYMLNAVYPLTNWIVIEAYSDTYYTTGVSYWADNWPIDPATNQPQRRFIEGAGVDVNYLTIIGQNGHLDWAVQRYNSLPFRKNDPNGNEIPHNGGIVGTVSYDTTRNELDPRYAAIENWQVGIPGLTVNLYKPQTCTGYTLQAGEACVANPNGAGSYVADATGAIKKGTLLNSTETESWVRPTNCQSYDADGQTIDYPALAPVSPANDCLEGPMAGVQFGSEYAAVDGNWGFTEDANGTPLTPGDYLVEVVTPLDAYGRAVYQVTREEDINVFNGDSYTPQVAAPACAGALHTVDVAGIGADGAAAVTNPNLVAEGGSPYEGQGKRLCDTKLVNLGNGRSVAPGFNFFTQVPIPGRWYGYIVDDLNLSMNPNELFFGEKAGVPNSPIGVYDYANRLVRMIESDPNGVFEVLLPSTETINCPTPTGVCANLYRIVGNDPGTPGNLSPNYNPQFRTIAATFEVFPGDIEPADLAPTQIGVSIQAPGSQINASVSCRLDNNPATAQPQLFAVDKPYVHFENSANTIGDRVLTIKGQGFGAAGSLVLSRTNGNGFAEVRTLTVASWSNNQIVVTVPAINGIPPSSQVLPGQWQLSITNATSGMSLVNGLTIHVLQNGVYNPPLLEVGPGKPYASIQAAINAFPNSGNGLIVVYPGGVPDSTNPTYNPQLAYFENLIIDKPVKLQGVGPGGVYTDAAGNAVSVGGTTTVDGSIIDGSAFGGDTPLASSWRTLMAAKLDRGWLGNQTIYEGAVITAVAPRTNTYNVNRPLQIDGFKIQGGDQQGFPGNLTEIYGLPNGVAPNVQVQGGGIYANSYVDYLTLTNNIFQSNGGAYGGAIRIGTPNLPGIANDGQNDRTSILHNRIIANGSTNLAGAIGLFSGTQNYDIGYNDICGNFSAEYGGAIGHYGLSNGGKIHANRIYFNRSYDEGGAVMIAGELPTDPAANYGAPNGAKGAGNVDIYNNLIQGNLSNDDGGGLRLLMTGTYTYNVYNNIIVNNIATHEGGGVALDDAPNVRFYNNTVMKNITTATAVTSDGTPAAAGLATGMNSDQLQAVLPVGASTFGNPLLFNNIFWDNRAGSFNSSTLSGIGTGGPADINLWDMGVMGGNGGELLSPTNSILNVATGTLASPTNSSANPLVVDGSYDVSVLVLPWRTMPGMVGSTIVAVDLPPNLLGNYHLAAGSPAVNMGAASKDGRSAPSTDIDDQTRSAPIDAGADELLGGVVVPPADPTLPSLTLRDDFTRSTNNPNSLNQGAPNGVNWSQPNNNLRVRSSRADAGNTGQAIWNGTGSAFGATQGAAFTFANTTLNGAALFLKATSGSSSLPSRFIRVQYQTNSGGQVVVSTTTNGSNFTTHGTLAGSFANGDTLSAVANADGSVDVWKTSGPTTSYLGHVTIPTSGGNSWSYGTGGGRIGIYLPNNARVDNFSAQTLP